MLKTKSLIAHFMLMLPVLLLVACSGCYRVGAPGGAPAGDALVVIASDVHLSATVDKAERLQAAIRSANRLAATAFIISGDAVARAADPDRNFIAELTAMGSEFAGERFAVALGNHDYRKDAQSSSDAPLPEGRQQEMEAMWREIGDTPPYQSFDVNGYAFLLLNTYRGHNEGRFFDDEQLDWFEQQLESASRVIIVMHHPVLTDRFWWLFWVPDIVTPAREARFFDALKKHRSKIHALFVGHGHFWMSDSLHHRIPVYMTTSLGEADNPGVHVVGLGAETVEVRRLLAKDLGMLKGAS